ncbi:segregation/condensation protein A [Streptomyces sp. NPDC046862]|uniref:segregation and condensation protein A n=1 Tax=Streptomyces sp. NPDC046862 TaxID=3154603 RepID=UPI0034561AC9
MTSSPASASGGSAGRRRALGRGPGAGSPPPSSPAAGSESPAEDGSSADPQAAPPGEPEQSQPSPEPEGVGPRAEPEGAAPLPEAEVVGPQAEPDEVPARPQADAPVPDARPGPDAESTGATGEPAEASAPVEAGAPVEASEAGQTSDGVFKVRLANFEGPFDLLLQLISKHKMDVTEVALSKVTDEFMAHIRAMGPDWDLDQTTEFLVVAATLLDLKAARLLPSAEVEDEADLALLEARDLLFARLLQYRAYKQIADIFSGRLDDEARRYPRTVGLEPHHAELLPEVVISIGAEGFAKLAVKAMQPKPKPQVYVDHIHAPLVSVQEQAGIVVARLRELGETSFRVLVEDTDDTLTVVARFLALLELYREKAVALEQEAALGELLVRWTGGEGEDRPMVTDEFDRPPELPKEEEKKA